MIGIIDYGCSNINAVKNILDSLHIKNKVLIDGNTTNCIDKYILPGVSAFDSSMRNINQDIDRVLARGRSESGGLYSQVLIKMNSRVTLTAGYTWYMIDLLIDKWVL